MKKPGFIYGKVEAQEKKGNRGLYPETLSEP